MENQNIDPSAYREFEDEEHTVHCSWWYMDRRYEGWFKPEDLEVDVVDKGAPQITP